MSRPAGAHGSPAKDPGLYNVDNFGSERVPENTDGRFGRLFELAVGGGDAENGKMLPHPATQYDLTLLGAKGGPLDTSISGNAPAKNARDSLVPAGITFLGQFIDHDITLDVSSKFTRPQINAALENARTPNLDLDCIYGGGREASPFLYVNSGEGANSWKNAMLIEGDKISLGTNNQRDLQRNNDGGTKGGGRAVIGDPRNDENILVAQTHAAFIRFHNRCVEELHKSTDHKSAGVEELFELARDTTTHYYHRIILEVFSSM